MTIKGKEDEYGEGTVRFVGIVKFDAGKWVGIELDKAAGKHDGVVKGERYFQTKPNHAVFTKYGQTNAIGGVAPVAGVKPKVTVSAPGVASAKKVASKIGTGLSSKPGSTPASSQVSSASTSAAPTPPNELDDTPEPSSESSLSTVAESPATTTPSTPERSISPEKSSIPISPASSAPVTPLAQTPIPEQPKEILRSPSPAKIASPSPQTVDLPRTTSPAPKSAIPTTPSKIPSATAKASPSKMPASPSKTEVKPKKVEPAASSSNATSSPSVDDGESAYEMELRIRGLEAERDSLKAANARLEDQLSILKEGSESLMAAQQAGGAAREAVEAELKTQIRDLKAKLEAAMDRCSDAEKRSRELELQVASATKSSTDAVSSAVQKATADLTAAFNKLKAETEEKIETLSTDLEMVTMDKEIAEEERDSAMKDLEALKLQQELLESQLAQNTEISKIRESEPSGEAGLNVTESAEYVALNTQHERLKEALVKLKDLAIEEKQQHEKAQREIEQFSLRTVPALEDKVLKLSELNIDYEEQIEILKANIDDSAELQEKYSELFEKKLDVEEENKKLKGALKELESIREISDQLEEEQQAMEQRLKQELYAKQVEVLNGEASLKNATAEIKAHQTMVERLQGLLAEQRTHSAETEKRLQTALKSRRRGRRRRMPIDLEDGEELPIDDETEMFDSEEEEGEESEDGYDLAPSSSTRSLSQKESEIQVMLQKQAARAASQALVDKLRELERAQAIENYSLFQAFVPESYIRVDSEAIKCLLLNKRLLEKSTIITQYLQEQYHLEKFERSAVVQEDVSTLTLTTTEELSYFAWRLAELITRLGTNAAILIENFKNCDNETYLRFSRLLTDLSPCEKKLDHLITLLQQEELTVSYSVQDFEVLLENFDSIITQYCSFTAIPASQHYMRLGAELVFASRACFFEVIALRREMNQLSQAVNVASVASALDLVSQTIVKYLVDGSRKLARAAEGRPAMAYMGNTLLALKSTVKLASTLEALFANLRHRVATEGERLDETGLNELQETVLSQSNKVIDEILKNLPPSQETSGRLTKPFDSAVTSGLKFLFTLEEEIARGAHDDLSSASPGLDSSVAAASSPSVNSGRGGSDKLVRGVPITSVAQLNARATILLEEVAAAAGLKGELASLQRELREREATLGYKAKEIEDLEFRLKKQEHRLGVLEKVESEAKEELASHQKNYASQVMHLETANRELTEQLETTTSEREEAKKLAFSNSSRVAALEEQLAANLHKAQHSMSLDSATTQISSLRAAVRHLSAQVQRLRAAETKSNLQHKLPPLLMTPVPTQLSQGTTAPKDLTLGPQAKESPEAGNETVDPTAASEPLSKATRLSPAAESIIPLDMAKLIDSAYALSTTPVVVDLTRTDQSPANQLESLQFESLRVKAALLQASRQTVQELAETKNKLASSHFSSFPNTSFVAAINATAKGPIRVGTITMPAPSTASSKMPLIKAPKTVHVSPADLSSIHTMLVK